MLMKVAGVTVVPRKLPPSICFQSGRLFPFEFQQGGKRETVADMGVRLSKFVIFIDVVSSEPLMCREVSGNVFKW